MTQLRGVIVFAGAGALAWLWLGLTLGYAAEVCITIPNAQVANFVDEFAEAGGCKVQGNNCVLNFGDQGVGENVPVPTPHLMSKTDFARVVAKRLLVEFYARRKAQEAADAAHSSTAAQATQDLE